MTKGQLIAELIESLVIAKVEEMITFKDDPAQYGITSEARRELAEFLDKEDSQMKVPQRNVNLANKLMHLSLMATSTAMGLTTSVKGQPLDLESLENVLLDNISFIREYKRKVNPVEVRGQRA